MNDGTLTMIQQPAAAQKFCTSCGTACAGDRSCPRCALLVAAAMSAQPAALEPERSLSALRPGLVLYFTLLGLHPLSAIAVACDADPLAMEWLWSASFSAVVLAFCLMNRRSLPPLSATGSARWCLAAPLMAAGTFAAGLGFSMLLEPLLPAPPVDPLEESIAAGVPPALLAASCCLVPAIFEELAFRGVMFGTMRKVLGPAETVVVTALLFTILHLSIAMLPFLFFAGLLLGWMRLRTGSLVPGMVLHFTHNALILWLASGGVHS